MSTPTLQFHHLEIPGLVVIEPAVFGDERGFFYESYRKEHFASHGINVEFVQHNHSKSQKGVMRGLHFQAPPVALAKLVRVVAGRAYDVAVDLRNGSPTYGKWFGIELSAGNKKMFYVPEGFAHGFMALEDDTEFLYQQTNYWTPSSEGGLRYNDPALGISWPLTQGVIVNDRDAHFPLLAELNSPFVFSS